MADFEKINFNENLISLLSFAYKARQLELGMEAVRRSLSRNKIGLILLSVTVGKDSLKKIKILIKEYKVPVFLFDENQLWAKLVPLQGYKIIGVHRGGFVKGFLQKIYSGV